MRREYVICAPRYCGSAGVRALYSLREELEKKGFRARIFLFARPKLFEENPTPFINKALTEVERREGIVIYPETIWGNPLGFKRVVRWVLNTPGLLAGDSDYPPEELVFAWSRVYFDTDRILQVDLLDRKLFYDSGLPKTTDVVFTYKGGKVRPTPELDDLPQITMQWPATRTELAELLRRTRTLYSHDAHSTLHDEALACGAQVKIITETGVRDLVDVSTNRDASVFCGQLENFIQLTQHMEGLASASEHWPLAMRIMVGLFACLLYPVKRCGKSSAFNRFWVYLQQKIWLHQ